MKNYLSIFLMLNVLLYLKIYAKRTNHSEAGKEKTEKVTMTRLLDLSAQRKNSDNEKHKICLFFVCFFLFCFSVTRVHLELHTWQSETKAAQSSISDGEKEQKKEKEWLLVEGGGWTMDGAAPHRRTALERTHHLCSFVELSHFNPPAKPFGNQLYGTERPPPLTLQSFSSVSVSISTPVLLRSAVRCPFTKTLPKPTGLPRVGWSGRAFSCCVRSMCLSFLLLMERITKQEK